MLSPPPFFFFRINSLVVFPCPPQFSSASNVCSKYKVIFISVFWEKSQSRSPNCTNKFEEKFVLPNGGETIPSSKQRIFYFLREAFIKPMSPNQFGL